MQANDADASTSCAPDCASGCVLAPDARRALERLARAVAEDDIDAAIAEGLLDYIPLRERASSARGLHDDPDGAKPPVHPCDFCLNRDRAVVAARDARLHALAARERFRAREARLRLREQARASRRGASAAPVSSDAAQTDHTTEPQGPSSAAPAPHSAGLPAAAAAALARAKAKAAARGTKG